MTKRLILCNCLASQSGDAATIESAASLPCSKWYTSLCTDQIDAAAKEIATGDVIIACQQERARFEALAEEIGAEVPGFLDIRDRAGWTSEGEDPSAKMAALAAEALLDQAAEKTVDVISEGTCLITGPADVALQAAEDLCETLAVTILLSDPEAAVNDPRFDCITGKLARVSGALGGFSLRIDQLRQVTPGGRGGVSLSDPRDGATSDCDIILDLSGDAALVPAPEKREGYLRADPKSAPAVAKVVLQASQMVGTFEKPLYVRLEPSLCAHSRAEQVGCSNCLGVCPTGAITPAGDHVAIDPMICAGCGSCSAVCPSGAISYDAPPVDTLFRRLSTLATTYRGAGGKAPRLLVHDASHGREMISLSARYGKGLPGDVIPFEIDALAGFGHAEMLGALATGFSEVALLLSPTTERDALDRDVPLARAIAGEDRVTVIDLADPDQLSELLYDFRAKTPALTDPVLPIGSRRQVARVAAKALRPEEDTIDLPEGAPYGAILVDTDACTLCLSCVSLCPSGALGDNPDKPQLRFQEDACLQCGLCATICPEDAIALKPQLNLTDEAFTQTVLNEEEPFACVECGTLFGSSSTISRIMDKLAGSHPMFATSDQARMIQMCENCRINAQYHSENNPFAGGDRPKVRTTDDYFSKRKDH